MRRPSFQFVSIVSLFVVMAATSLAWLSYGRRPVHADRASLMEIAHRYPNFSMAQRMALLRARQSQLHPRWRDLSFAEALRLLYKMATSATTTTAPPANFSGNKTKIANPGTDFLALSRQSDCSLTLRDLPYTLDQTSLSLSYTIADSIPHYDQVLHQAAGLTTTGGNFPVGCGDPVLGVSSRKIVYLGLTSSSIKVYAGTFYNSMLQQQQIFTLTAKADDTWLSSAMLATINSTNLAAADLNGDGNGDLVSVTESTGTGNASLAVFLGNADGTFQAPVSYQLPGVVARSAVIDDINGDGNPDILASSETLSGNGVAGYDITFFAGKGDGTFAAPRSFTITPPSNSQIATLDGLITADLRGIGKKDIVSASGIVLLGNGDGSFTQTANPGFPTPDATNDQGPNVVAGDFNKDGKIDLAVGTGTSVLIYNGAGDGSFTPGNAYASISDIGALTATDLDGDGNIDLYVGFGNGGMIGGDNFEFGEGYALMGHGDGTFSGAPIAPFVSSGNNVADLNGDGIVDGVGVTSTSTGVSFVSYLGHKDGSFTVKSTLTASPITVSGIPQNFSTIDSYGLGDINGDGKADLVYISGNYDGFFTATGNGDGTFNTPVYSPVHTLIPAPNGVYDPSINSMFLADFNHDGNADIIYTFSDEGASSPDYIDGLAVQLSNGDGTFQAPQLILSYSGTTTPPSSATILVDQIGDVNGDGFPDLLTLQYGPPDAQGNTNFELQLRLGKGDGTFLSPTLPAVADGIEPAVGISTYGPVALADMNGDGHIDIISLGDGSSLGNEVAISLGNGDGTFKPPILTYFNGYGALGAFLTIADFNGDGKPDVFTDGFDPPFDTGIFIGNGDGTLKNFTYNGVAQPALSIGLYVEGYALAPDFNGDGKPDLFAGGVALINEAGAVASTISTTTTLTASATSISAGSSVTFTAKVASASGTAIPTGTVAFVNGTTQLGTATLDGTGTATFTPASLAAGSYTIVATYGGDSNFAVSSSTLVTLTVTTPIIATSTALTVSASTITAGENVTFTAVTTAASGTAIPAGGVTFSNGATQLGSGMLDSTGTARFSTTALAAGTYTVTSDYAGNSAFGPSTSPPVSLTVSAAVTPDFAVSLSPASGTVAAGASTTSTVSITSSGGFDQQTTFACSSAPAGGSCTFSPSSVTPNGSVAATATLTIQTAATTASTEKLSSRREEPRSVLPVTLALLFSGGGVFAFPRKRFGRQRKLITLLLVLGTCTLIQACGGRSSKTSTTTTTTSTVTVTATAGSLSHSAIYYLTVN